MSVESRFSNSAGLVQAVLATIPDGSYVAGSAGFDAVKQPPYAKILNNSGFDFAGTVVAMVVT